MKRQYFLAAAVITGTMALTTSAVAKDRETGRGTGPVVCVGSRGLFNDSIVLADLPAPGRFQRLRAGVGPSGLATENGPGHLGGRWWIDANDDGYMDDGDTLFRCVLPGPGRSVLS